MNSRQFVACILVRDRPKVVWPGFLGMLIAPEQTLRLPKLVACMLQLIKHYQNEVKAPYLQSQVLRGWTPLYRRSEPLQAY